MNDGPNNLSEFEVALATTPAPEPASYDDEDRIRRETVRRHLELLIEAGDAEEIGRFVLVSAYEIALPNAPKSIDELAEKLGVSRRRAYQILEKIAQTTP